MKRFLLILTVISSLTLSAAAQSTWKAVDTHQYNDETVVYATLQVNDHAVGADNTDYDVAAFVDDECRDVVIEAAQGENRQSVFVLRVHGKRDADAGKPVRFEIRYTPGEMMLVYDVTSSQAVSFNGESWGQPSAPVVLSGKGYEGDAKFAFSPAVIDVGETVDIVSLFQGGTMPKYESIELSAEGIVRLDGTVAKGLKTGTVTFTVRFSSNVTLSSTITVSQSVALQHFEYDFNDHPYNNEMVQMTLTPVPANASFDISDLRFRYHADFDWQEVWNIVDFELVSREPIIYNVTFHVPIGVDVRPYWNSSPETDIELWPAGGSEKDSYIKPYFRLDLKEGWQWRTNPCGNLFANDLLIGFGAYLIEARTQNELLYNDPKWGYFGTMMEGDGISDNVAYKVRMAADYRSRTFGLTVNGTSEFTLPVGEGWIWMPSPYLYDRRLENIFYDDQLIEGLTIVSKEQGSAEWDGSKWQGDLEVLTAEQSFLLYIPEGDPFELRFKNERTMAQGNEMPAGVRSDVLRSTTNGQSSMNTVARRFRDNMTMVVTMPQLPNPDDYQIEAYVGGELRGLGTCRNGRYFVTVHADGGERVNFRLTDLNSGALYAVDERITVSQPRLGSLRQPVELHSAAATQGVGKVWSEKCEVSTYDLLGRSADSSRKNVITIQRSADGSVHKVIRK